MASQITRLTIVYSTVYPDADQRKHQSSVSLAFVRGIHRWPVNSPHKWPVTRKLFPFDDVIMKSILLGGNATRIQDWEATAKILQWLPKLDIHPSWGEIDLQWSLIENCFIIARYHIYWYGVIMTSEDLDKTACITSQRTLHSSPSRVNYGVSFVSILWKISGYKMIRL